MIQIQWTEPEWDGGSPIVGYEIKLSTDGRRTFTDVMLKSRTNSRRKESAPPLFSLCTASDTGADQWSRAPIAVAPGSNRPMRA